MEVRIVTIQIIIVLLFALNLLLGWLAHFKKNFSWYRLPGWAIMVVLPLITVLAEQPKFELDYDWWRVAGAAAILLGGALVAWAKRVRAGQELVTAGPYAFVRHPIYLGLIFVFVGWWWIWAAVYSFYFGMFILAMLWLEAYLEEKLILEKQFGAKFHDYKRQTGMFWIK
jgi:protein-S-isoprenylcysteine O-methyltransferase Ste14